jgi:hypothetical protein
MTYREVIRPPWWTYLVMVGLVALFCFTFAAVVGGPVALILFVVAAAVLAWIISRRALRLTVDEGSFRIGELEVPRTAILDAVPLDEQGLRDLAGRDANGQALLVLRNLATKQGVKVDLEAQRWPYVLVSSLEPAELAAALRG